MMLRFTTVLQSLSTSIIRQQKGLPSPSAYQNQILLVNSFWSCDSYCCCHYSNKPVGNLVAARKDDDKDEGQTLSSKKQRKSSKLRSYVKHFMDSTRIHVKGGKGGAGVPQKGGCGGRGGDVILAGVKDLKLKDVVSAVPSKRYAAGSGKDAKLFCLIGQPGESSIIEVPLGISVISELGNKMGEINEAGDKVIVAKGGDGGNLNNGFCGMKGEAQSITLDLKLIADIGFVGFPNAGKSTLLKAISRASPKIASYPFTTVRPNVGVIEFSDFRKISLADLPGLIEGAHLNTGMGHKFLKHVERTKLLLFIVDIHGFQLSPKYPIRSALQTIILLNRELELYLADLAEKPAILVLNKYDLPGSYPIIESIKEVYKNKETLNEYIQTLPAEFRPQQLMEFQKIIPISAKTDMTSVHLLRDTLRTALDVNEDLKRIEIEERMRMRRTSSSQEE